MVQTDKHKLSFIYFLFFVSGFTSLIYEVLWLKQLRLLFGSTAYAVATTLTVFFLGLAIGGYLFGKLAPKLKNLLRTLAFIEFGIGTAALLYFPLLDVFHLIYPNLYEFAGGSLLFMTLFKFLLALILLLPAAVLIGATLPLISHFLVKKKDELGKKISFLYGINTLGAALGVLAAGFLLPQLIGFNSSYILAISLNATIAASFFYLSFRMKTYAIPAGQVTHTVAAERYVMPLIFFSGFAVLSLEVLWTLMFAQVIINDIYSFSLILVTFLTSLAGGAFIASYLSRLTINPWIILNRLLISSAILIGLSPLFFYLATSGLIPLATTGGLGNYLFSLFGMAAVIMLIPATVIGTIFPYLLKLMSSQEKSPGEIVGSWVSINTIGAILGALFAGFVSVKFLGLWMSIGLMASLYLVLSIFVRRAYQKKASRKNLIFALTLGLLFLIVIPTTLFSVRLDPLTREVLVEKFTGPDGVVAVVSSHPPYYPEGFDDLFIRLNGNYTLGGVGSLASEQRQAHLPLFLHPNPKSVFFIGMGTGITAGASLYHPVDKVVTTEVIPEVVTASEQYFVKYVNGLFSDERSVVLTEDGRNYLSGTDEKFDVIVGDIFNPWSEGIGNLYTKEHFENVGEHLAEGGIYAQWLPTYQLTEEQFGSIVKTYLAVFPEVTLWRGNFIPDKPIVALVGQNNKSPLNPDSLITNVNFLGENDRDEVLIDALVSVKGLGILVINPEAKETLSEALPQLSQSVPFTFYAGNLSENEKLFSKFPINTDDRPEVEFLSLLAATDQGPGGTTFLADFELERLYQELITSTPPEEDPYLANLSPEQLIYVYAGLTYYQSNLHEFIGQLTGNKEEIELSQRLFSEYLTKIDLTKPAL